MSGFLTLERTSVAAFRGFERPQMAGLQGLDRPGGQASAADAGAAAPTSDLDLQIVGGLQFFEQATQLAGADAQAGRHALLAAPGAAFAGVQVVEDEAGDGLGREADRGITGDALMPGQFSRR